jgi:hypothetical protein
MLFYFLKIVHFKNGVNDFCYFARPTDQKQTVFTQYMQQKAKNNFHRKQLLSKGAIMCFLTIL